MLQKDFRKPYRSKKVENKSEVITKVIQEYLILFFIKKKKNSNTNVADITPFEKSIENLKLLTELDLSFK